MTAGINQSLAQASPLMTSNPAQAVQVMSQAARTHPNGQATFVSMIDALTNGTDVPNPVPLLGPRTIHVGPNDPRLTQGIIARAGAAGITLTPQHLDFIRAHAAEFRAQLQ